MPTKFCSKCGGKNEYEYEAPKKCKCGFNFADAFKIVASDISTPKIAIEKLIKAELPQEDDEEYETIRIKKKKKNTLKKSTAEKTLEEMEQEEFSEDDFDPDEVESEAMEIAASLDESDFLKEIDAPIENLLDILKRNTKE